MRIMTQSSILLYGENTVLSRQALLDNISAVTSADVEVLHLNGKTLEITDLTQAIEASSLFARKRVIVIEDLFLQRKKSQLKSLLAYINVSATDPDLPDFILWEGKKLTATQCRSVSNIPATEFKASSYLFPFLDSIQPNQQLRMINAFNAALANDPPELLFFMLARHIHEMIMARDGVLPGPPWRVGKLKKQAATFKADMLEQLSLKLGDIDWEFKSGKSSVGLQIRLELLLCSM